MALIIKNREVVEDRWHTVRANAEGQLPEPQDLPQGPVLVPFSYWTTYRDALTAAHSKADLGIWLAPTDEPAALLDDLDAVTVLAVDFPAFKDGRGISIARLLRERYGWKGEIRAIGDVLRDQIGYMSRCGIDAFAVRADKDIHDALHAFDELTLHYQGAVDDPRPLFRRVPREGATSARAQALAAAIATTDAVSSAVGASAPVPAASVTRS